MYAFFINKLQCPWCQTAFSLFPYLSKSKEKILYGIISCQCSQHPIIDGVLFLLKNSPRAKALFFLKKNKGKLRKLTNIPFFLFNLPLNSKVLFFLISFFAKLKLLDFISFKNFLNLLVFFKFLNKTEAFYYLNRLNNKIFLPTAISAKLVKKDRVVLDAGTGTGQLLFLFKKIVKERNICGLDKSLIRIYLAKKYFCSDCNYIYYDLNNPLPFKSESIDNIFCSDCFHYLANQKQLGDEFSRIITKKGLIILNHLHNRDFFHCFDKDEYLNNLNGYLSFFSKFDYFLYSEQFVDKGILKFVDKKDKKKIFKKAKKLKTFSLFLFNKNLKNKPDRSILENN